MQPRIYTYKITFEEVPYWYWGVHKEKKFGELYLGSPVTHRWMWDFYTPEVQILELFPYTEEGWKEANLVEYRLIWPDLNNLLCLNEHCGGTTSYEGCSKGGRKAFNMLNAEKDEEGKSVFARQASRKAHAERTPDGRSVRGILSGARLHQEKTEEGKSLAGVKGSSKTHSRKNNEGKSIVGVNWGTKAAAKLHAERTEDGKSLHGIRLAEKTHAKKTADGKSEHAVRRGQKLNKELWKCLVTGKITNSGALTNWQRARNIDTSNRVKVTNKEES
jgi:hypothetical protein